MTNRRAPSRAGACDPEARGRRDAPRARTVRARSRPDEEAARARSAVDRHYAGEARAFSGGWAAVLDAFSAPLIDTLDIRPGARLLDAGSGTALTAVRLARAGAAAHAIDRSRAMLARATGSEALAGLAAADVGALPFRDDRFDVVLTLFVLNHVPDQVDAAREMRRVLAPGGRLGVALWGRGPMDCPAFLAWSALLDAHGAPDDPAPPRSWERRIDTARKIAVLLGRAGFTEVHAWKERRRIATSPRAFLLATLRGGSLGRRLSALPEDRRAAFRAEGRALLRTFGPEAFVWRGAVICATAQKPRPH